MSNFSTFPKKNFSAEGRNPKSRMSSKFSTEIRKFGPQKRAQMRVSLGFWPNLAQFWAKFGQILKPKISQISQKPRLTLKCRIPKVYILKNVNFGFLEPTVHSFCTKVLKTGPKNHQFSGESGFLAFPKIFPIFENWPKAKYPDSPSNPAFFPTHSEKWTEGLLEAYGAQFSAEG